MKIAELLDRDLTALSEDNTVAEAIEVFFQHHTTGVPVVDENNVVVGFITEKDITKAALPEYVSMLKDSSFLPDCNQFAARLFAIRNNPVSMYMQKNVITFNEDDSDFYAASTFIQKSIKLAPVVKDGKLLGIVSRSNLLKHILEHEIVQSC